MTSSTSAVLGAPGPPSGYATFESPSLVKQSVSEASLLSRALFSFARPLLAAGNHRQLQPADLWSLEGGDELERAFDDLDRSFRRNDGRLARALVANYAPMFAWFGLAALLSVFCGSVAAPVAMHQVISAFGSAQVDVRGAALWLVGFLLLKLVTAVVESQANFQREAAVIRLVGSVKMLLFRKVLRRSTAARAAHTEPQTLMSVDSNVLMHTCFQINNLWLLPLQIVVILSLLVAILDWAALAGAAVVVLSILATTAVARVSGRTFSSIQKQRDLRMKSVRELFGAIQVVKLNAWEDKFLAKIGALRVVELAALATYRYIGAVTAFVQWASPIFVSATSFAVYVLVLGKTLTAAKVFTAIALFNALQEPLRDFPNAVQIMIRAQVAFQRMSAFLDLEEFDATNVVRDGAAYPDDVAISVKSGAFEWTAGLPTLRNIELIVHRGDLVVVHGPVGSGKSSLISALLGEITKLSGDVFVRGRVAYYSQQPWIQNSTIRDNILFGQAFDRTKYERVVVACGLLPDLQQLPSGDLTEIGQKGITLSGGQKARVSLARVCYADADVLLLDSPLAAVDAVVQSEIFNNCICGLLQDKTVILVTHSPEVIASKAVDCRVAMANGQATVIRGKPNKPHAPAGGSKFTQVTHEQTTALRSVIRDMAPVVKEETREEGRVSSKIFMEYFESFGGLKVCLALLAISVLGQTFQIAGDIWLSRWTGQKDFEAHNQDTRANMEIYAALGAAGALMVLARSTMIAVAGVRASKYLFNAMVRGTIHSPLRFFDLNPIGRILNRFIEDMSAVDFQLPSIFGNFFPTCLTTVCQLATAVYAVNFLGVLVLPLVYMYIRLGGFTLAPSREISRLWLASTSPVLTICSESDEGAEVIRAFGREFMDRAMVEHCARLTINSTAWYSENITTHWFQIRIKALGCAVIGAIVASAMYFRDEISPGFVGLAFAYALNVDSSLANLVEKWSWLEMAMISAERVLEYAALEPEDANQLVVIEPSSEWPVKETVRFENVVFNYKPGDAPVLKSVSFAINSKEKVGIVGRTGAGKSSLVMALFRVNSTVSGRILIDGIDIATLPLRTLRSRLSIIPQSPVLFKGPLREYMDPFQSFSDAQVWDALTKVGMERQVGALEGALAFQVSENGDNFSAGERQLLCMARALLTKTRIVVMDEATASIDRATEQKVQEMLARDFADATVLTIAHRLATVLASNRILVLSEGEVVEFGAPKELAVRPDGVFQRLVKEDGHSEELC